MLRDPVILALDDPLLGIVSEMETFVSKNRQEITEDLVTLEFWDVFHAHDIRFHLSDEPAEILEQGPFGVSLILKPLRVF